MDDLGAMLGAVDNFIIVIYHILTPVYLLAICFNIFRTVALD